MNLIKLFNFCVIYLVFQIASNAEDMKYIEETELFFNERCEPQCIVTENLHNNSSIAAGVLTSEIIDLFPKNCKKICCEIIINGESGVSEEQLTSTFQNMKHLVGSLHVTNTKYGSGRFLSNLEILECGSHGFLWEKNNMMYDMGLTSLKTVICDDFRIQNNVAMQKLNLPNLKNLVPRNVNNSNIKVSLSGTFSPMRVTVQEALTFLNNPDVVFKASRVFYSDSATDSDNCIVKNSTFWDIAEKCRHISGNVRILKDNEHKVNRLKNIEFIFGALLITQTSLEKIDFFDNLKGIFSLAKPCINVEYNANLINVSFPSLTRVETPSTTLHSDVVFWQNNNILSKDPIFCDRFDQLFNMTSEKQYAAFDGKSCEKIKKEYSNGISRFGRMPTMLLFSITFQMFN